MTTTHTPGPLGLDTASLTALLCDADGTLFPSEEPAYAASATVTNRFLAGLGATRDYEPSELQALTNGKNFRGAAPDLAAHVGGTLDDVDLDDWVRREKEVVTEHLRTVLRPDPTVTSALTTLNERFRLAAVTSSAASRLDACLEITGLAGLFTPEDRFSAEDSLESPVSKPDPAVYLWAAQRLGVEPAAGLAVEDSVNGARSAVAAGHPTVGILQFVPAEARETRRRDLEDLGVVAVVEDWSGLVGLLTPS